jgi:hypothetical protein
MTMPADSARLRNLVPGKTCPWLITLMPIWISTPAQNSSSWAARLQSRFAQRQLGNAHQFGRQILHRDMKDRQIAVTQRTLAVNELQPDPDVPVAPSASSWIGSHSCDCSLKPIQCTGFAEPRQSRALRFPEAVGGGCFGNLDRGNVIDRRHGSRQSGRELVQWVAVGASSGVA